MTRIHANNFITTLNGAISSGATSIILTSVTGFPAVGAGVTCNVTLANGADIEIVTATAISSFTLTVTRAAEGTIAKAFANGSTVSIRPTADSIDRKMDIAGTTTNPQANNFLAGYTTTATAAGTTTLTVASTQQQFFTGTTTQTCVLPVTSTLVLGLTYEIVNNSTGVVTVQSSGANTIVAMDAATKLVVTCISLSGTGTASWDYIYSPNASGITGTGSLVRATSPTLVTPALGTPASGALSSCTAYPQSALTGLGSNVSTFLGTPSSANLAAALTDETGSGAAVFANTPTLVTPVLGAATATSINFGQDSLNYYDEGTWTPVFTFATPGDLSVGYTTQTGTYTRVGRMIFIHCVVNFTPTFTTASGNINITGLPFAALTNYGGATLDASGLTYSAGRTSACFSTSASLLRVLVAGSNVSSDLLTTASLVSGVAASLRGTVVYQI